MSKMRNVALVLGGLLMGCGAGAVATRGAFAVDPLSMPSAPTAVVRWEQFCEELRPNPKELNYVLAARGAEGWEVVAIPYTWTGQGAAGAVCFKRPAPTGRFAPSTL
jgi:hypothetical protein